MMQCSIVMKISRITRCCMTIADSTMNDNLPLPDEEAMMIANALLTKSPFYDAETSTKDQIQRDLRDLIAGADVCEEEDRIDDAMKFVAAAVSGLRECPSGFVSDTLATLILKKQFVTAKRLHGESSSQALKAKLDLDNSTTNGPQKMKISQVGQFSPLGARCWNAGCKQTATKRNETNPNDDDGAESSLKVCGKCKLALYCSQACQVDDWHAGHKVQCKVIAK